MNRARKPTIVIAIPAVSPTPAPILLIEKTAEVGEVVAAGGAVAMVSPVVFHSDDEGALGVVDDEVALAVAVADAWKLVTVGFEVVIVDCGLGVWDCELVTADCELATGDCRIVTVDWGAVIEEEIAVKPPGSTTPRVLYVPRLMMLSVCVQQLASPPQQYVVLEH